MPRHTGLDLVAELLTTSREYDEWLPRIEPAQTCSAKARA